MNKLSKLAFIAATAAFAASASAQSVPLSQQTSTDNWANGSQEYVWTNGSNELCWRSATWTPTTANPKCDGALVVQATETPPVVPQITSQKVTYQADTLFDFDKAVLKASGKAELDTLVHKVQSLNLEVIVATGHTDKIGKDGYNDQLSMKRAQAVKTYLASQGVDANRIYTEAKGKRNPVVTDCHQKKRKDLIECLAPNRRVEIEVVGTVTAQTNQPTQPEVTTVKPAY
ncbi:OmpA-OmpF porin, OOP family [Mycoavidus cysteinexigens]|uniref:OmpA-OmpF porin, OOP family n=1 Tax=Mycoavidus cysteinexigens TaxID=1553431 RepID=A0A2Z6EWU6_9BURK|nr:OmpA family protein [Mycoavidus cysteinexigens]BBE09927.1 OmpA-OmpF porin, OOP family [Mycoavidus cysteinexigens]GAM53728.1 outer membrane protein A precursor [bacterium endosymbiont of Mortierella elongata FMR23-6]GLR00367.1 membrane protein [Mycoavidus cysteinexigens]